MEALLIDEWIADEDAIRVVDDASVSLARQRSRDVAAAQGLSKEDAERLATIASELARNQLRHARGGAVAVRAIDRGGVRGVEVGAADRGDGLVDPRKALAGVPRTHGSLGTGVAAVRDLAYEVDFDVRLNEGTYVRARIFEKEPPRRRQIGIYGRPHRSEVTSGDNAIVVHGASGFVAAVADGLGHGRSAREASSKAVRTVRTCGRSGDAPHEILDACHRALESTRGAVMGVVRVHDKGATMETALAGNVAVQVVGPRTERRFGGSSFVLGSRGTRLAGGSEAAPLEHGELLVMFSDGISSRMSIKDDLALLREHPIVVAQHVVEQAGTDNDDVLVLVARVS